MGKQSVTTLIIDDNAQERAELVRLLSEDAQFAGRILEAENAAEGIKICLEERPDCVLLDYGLTKNDAPLILSAICPDPQKPLSAVILLAEAGDENDVRKTVGPEAINYLIKKEFSADALHRAVHQAIKSLRLIAEGRETDAILRESQLQTHLALEAARTVAFTWDIKTDVVRRLYGGVGTFPKTEDDTLADVAARVLETDRERFLENLKTALANPQQTYRAEYRVVQPDGSISWLNEMGRFITDENGEAIRLTGVSTDITERKIAEEHLRASEARLHLGVEVADFAISQIDYATGMFHLSKEAAILFGIDKAETTVPQETFYATFHPDDAPEIMRAIKEALIPEGEGWFALEHRIVRKNGDVRWLNVREQIVFDHTQNPPLPTIGILAAQDITERKETEKKIKQSEERYRALVKAAAQVEWIAAPDGDFIAPQSRWEEFTGQSFDEYRGSGWSAMLHPDDRERTLDAWQKAITKKSVYEIENRMRRRDGTYRWMQVRAVPILDARGGIREWIGANTDITERKNAEEALRVSHNTFRHLVENSPFGIFVVDADFRLSLVGAGAQRIFENVHPLIGRDFAEVLSVIWTEPFVGEAITLFRRTLETGEPYHSPSIIEKRADTGELESYDWKIERLTMPDGRFGVVCHFYDLSERQRYETQMRESEERFRLASDAGAALVYDADLTGTRQTIVYGLERVTGYQTNEVNPSSDWWHTLIHEADLPAHLEKHHQHLETGGTLRSVYRVRHKNGDWIWVEDKAQIVQDAEGSFTQLVGTIVDVTERKQAEDALLKQQRFTQSIVEAAPSLTYIYDIARSSNTFISPQSFPVLGYSMEEIHRLGSQILSVLLHPDDESRIAERFKKIIADLSDEIFELEYRMRRKDGEYVWLFDRARVFLRDLDGNPTQILGVATDITTRRQAEEQLRYQLQLTQNITETAAVAIFVSDRDGRISFVNPEAEKIFGYTLDELRGKVLHDAIHNKYPDGTPFPMNECALSRVFEDGIAVRDYESTFFRKDGSSVSAISSNTPIIENGEVTGEVTAMLDITSRKIEELSAQLLLRVSELIRETSDVDTLLTGVARLIGERLAVARCVVNLIDLENDLVTVRSEYKTGALASLVGSFPLSKYSHVTREFAERGQTIAVADTQTDERTAAWFEESYRPEGITAYIACPLMRENRWTATLWLSSGEPREWQEWEIALVKTVGERAWLAAEKLRSEKKVRESEERFRLLTENLDNVFWILNWQEKRSEYVSHAFNRLDGDEYTEALATDFENWTSIIHEEDRERARQDFLAIGETGRYESTYRILLPDGAIRWRHAKGSPIRDESGEVLRVVGVTEDITDRKLAEMQILESEQRLRLAADGAATFAWENDQTTQKITWSENAAKIIGCAPEDLPTDTKDSMFFVAPEEHERLLKHFDKVVRERLNNYIIEFRGRNGQHWQGHGLIIRNQHGDVVKIVGVTQNITKRKRAEERIQTANYRFRVAEEAAKGFNYEWNLETGMVTRSESIERVIGYTREELATTWQAWADLIHPDDRVVRSETEARRLLDGLRDETFSGEYRVRHKDGRHVWLMERGLVIRDAAGKIQRVVGQTMDISEQKQTQEKLLEAERRAVSDYRKLLARIAPLAQTLGTARELMTIYRALLDFIRLELPCEGFFVSFYDAENQLKQVKYVWSEGREIDAQAMQPIALFTNNGANSRAIREEKSIISTRNLEEMSGQFQVVSESNKRVVESLVTPMIVMGRVIGTLEAQNHGEKYAQEHVVALEMAANLAAVAIENVRLMNIESEARAAAEEANRAKDEFLAMLSHELRSPLNAMFGWTQILQTTNPDAEKTAKAIEVIARNVRLQKTLIEDLLDVSRIISGKMQLENENVPLAAIVYEAVDAARPSAEKQDIRIELEISAKTGEIHGDKHRLQQVIGNLLTNAVKFTPAGGAIRLALQNADGKIRLTVADTGIGIAPELLPRIFDRFLQADGGYKRKYGGLGLGLTIVKHLVELHGGSVVAHSEGEGRGAAFQLEFPLISQSAHAAEAQPDGDGQGFAQDNKKLDGARILAVDDEGDVLDLMSFVLKQQGAVVTCVNSAREALERLREQSFDLMISDLGMAEMDGFDLIQTIREAETGGVRHLPAIALTGFVSAQDRKRVLEAGFQNHLSKPVDLNNLLRVVVNLIKNEDQPHDSLAETSAR